MNENPLVEALETARRALDGLVFDTAQPDELAVLREGLNRVRGRWEVAHASFVRRVAALNEQGQAPQPEDELGSKAMMSESDARRVRRNAEVLDRFPQLADALGDGRVSTAHVDALAFNYSVADDSNRAALMVDDTALAAQAATMTVSEFQRTLRRRRDPRDAGETREMRSKRSNRMTVGWNTLTGRFDARLDADAVMGSRLDGSLNAEIDRMIREDDLADVHPDLRSDRSHLRLYALLNLTSVGHQTRRHAPTTAAVTEIAVHIDLATLASGEHAGTVCELANGQPISVEQARRLACDARIIPVVLDGEGRALDVGRAQRFATPDQRRLLRAMYSTCAYLGCEVSFDRCEIHHLLAWEELGPTDLANLLPLCGRHHHVVHDRGWRLHLDDRRTLFVQRPDGTWEAPQPLRPRRRSAHDVVAAGSVTALATTTAATATSDLAPSSAPQNGSADRAGRTGAGVGPRTGDGRSGDGRSDDGRAGRTGDGPPGRGSPGVDPPGVAPPGADPPGEQLTLVS